MNERNEPEVPPLDDDGELRGGQVLADKAAKPETSPGPPPPPPPPSRAS